MLVVIFIITIIKNVKCIKIEKQGSKLQSKPTTQQLKYCRILTQKFWVHQSLKSTHPVDVLIALWNDVSVEEGGFTGCAGQEEETRSDWCWWQEEKTEKVKYCPFFLTCWETHGNNDFCLAGGERGRWRVVQPRSAVNLPLESSNKTLTNIQTQTKPTNIEKKPQQTASVVIVLTGSKLGRL